MKRVVVTGMGVISPVGNDVNTFWESLVAGKNGIKLITRFDTSEHKVKVAAEVKNFEPTLYMEKSAVRRTDLYAQFAIAAAVQAMEDSGLSVLEDASDNKKGNIHPHRLGVYVGSGSGGIATTVEQCNKYAESGPRHVSPFLVPMMICNIAAGLIAIRVKAQGPCLPVVTACATSTNAIGEAYRNIKFGYSDAILAGGAEATINTVSMAGFTNCKALTTVSDPDNCCTPFDKRRSGFVMGEGGAVIMLEEYEHAKARGAKIYGEILGYGNTCDAFHITAPDAEAEGAARAISLALEEAGLTNNLAEKSIYINAHGTSTPLNDKTETIAIKKALGETVARKAMISSTKSMTGHMIGAAGAVELIASLLALRDGVIPPTIGYQESDPECDLDYVPNVSRKVQADIAISSSLGFGGHNACLIVSGV